MVVWNNDLPPALSAENLNSMVADIAFAMALAEQVGFNVLKEGAKGDATDAGGTDDTAAFQLAYNKAGAGLAFGIGGVVVIPARGYRLNNSVKVPSNVRTVGYGAILRKYAGYQVYSAFETLSNGATGYGSGGKNISFEGLTFKGSFGTSAAGCAVTLHHAQGVTFRKCVWEEAMISGHAVDLLGCNGVLFDDCEVRGLKITAGREYVEAIQCDYSVNGAGGSETNTASWDGLPTINVTVQNSRFLPLTVGGVTYPAPNPIGCHSRVDGRWIENIKFLNNYVEGGADTSTITDGFAQLTRGWLHFFCARNVQIIGNHFKNVSGRAARVLMCHPITTGTLVSDVQLATITSKSMTPMPATNFLLERNLFEGFNSDVGETVIDIRGVSGTKFRNVRFVNNEFKDCWSTPGTPADKGQDLIYLQDGISATLRDNDVQYGRGLVYAYRVSKLKIMGGTLKDIGFYAGRFSECNNVTIDDVDLENFGGAWWSYNNLTANSTATPQVQTNGFRIEGGSIIQGYTQAQLTGLAAQPVSMSGVNNFHVSGVYSPYNAATGYLKVFAVYNNSTNGRIEDNITPGYVDQVQTATAFGVASLAGSNILSQNNTV